MSNKYRLFHHTIIFHCKLGL